MKPAAHRPTLGQIKAAIGPLREFWARGQVARRVQHWPRGYIGDFESIELLLGGVEALDDADPAALLDRVFLASPICLQHHFKIRWQADRLLTGSRDHRGACKVLCIAVGGAQDVVAALPTLVHTHDQLVLNDIEPDALRLASDRLVALGDRVCLQPGNALRSRRALSAMGPFDLVIAGGLFDYLSQRQAALLCRVVKEHWLRPGGVFCFTNITRGHPFRYIMDGLGDWPLVERDRADLETVVQDLAGFSRLSISTDPTGLSWLVEARS